MADQVKEAPTPKSSEDYIQAAISGVKDLPPEPAVPETPVAEEKSGEEPPEPALKTEGEPAPEKKPAEEAPKPPEDVPDGIKRSFETLAREKAALRAEKAQIEANKETLERARRLLAAEDPVSLLAAKGFTHKQYTDQLIAGKFTPREEPKAPEEQSDVRKEVADLRAELKRRDADAAKAKLTDGIKARAVAGKDKFKFVQAMGAESEARVFLEDYWKQTGELPVPGDMAASMDVALEAVEKHLRKVGEKWKPLLTGNTGGSKTVPEVPKSAASQAASEQEAEKQHRTLTNSQAAAPRGSAPQQKTPRTDEEYQEAALAGLKALERS